MLRVPYWKDAITDPIGVTTAHGIIDKTITLPVQPEWLDPILTVVAISLVGAGVLLSWFLVRALNAKARQESQTTATGLLAFYLIPAIYGGLFVAMLIAWRMVG